MSRKKNHKKKKKERPLIRVPKFIQVFHRYVREDMADRQNPVLGVAMFKINTGDQQDYPELQNVNELYMYYQV